MIDRYTDTDTASFLAFLSTDPTRYRKNKFIFLTDPIPKTNLFSLTDPTRYRKFYFIPYRPDPIPKKILVAVPIPIPTENPMPVAFRDFVNSACSDIFFLIYFLCGNLKMDIWSVTATKPLPSPFLHRHGNILTWQIISNMFPKGHRRSILHQRSTLFLDYWMPMSLRALFQHCFYKCWYPCGHLRQIILNLKLIFQSILYICWNLYYLTLMLMLLCHPLGKSYVE